MPEENGAHADDNVQVDQPQQGTEPAAAEPAARQAQDPEPSFTPITTQEAFDKAIGPRLARERARFEGYDDLKQKAERLDEVTAQLDELKPVALERDRLAVALEKGLTATQAKRLVGTTREELEADADQLLADLGPQHRRPRPNPAQDSADSPPAGDWLRQQLKSR